MKIHEWRAEMGITQEQAARVFGVSVHCLIKWEWAARTGKVIKVRRRARFVEVLTMSREELRKEMDDGEG